MARQNELYNYSDKDRNYCSKCWTEFTLLTDQEIENLKQRAKFIKARNLKGKFT